MKRPPLFLHLKIQGQKWVPGCWLPLFLLVPLALVFLIVLSPLVFVAAVVLWLSGRRRRQLRIARTALGILCSPGGIKATLDLFCSTTGLRVDVSGPDEQVHVSVI